MASPRDAALAIEEEMTDAGKAATVVRNDPVLFLQFNDKNPALVQVVDDMLHSLYATGRYAFSSRWEGGMELLEVREA